MKKLIKALLIVTLIFLILVTAVGCGELSVLSEQMAAAISVTKLQDGLYSMEYKGDYGLDELMERGGAESSDALAAYLTEFLSHGFYTAETNEAENAYGCSTVSAKTQDRKAVFGRNYDWEECNVMIVRTVPENGYESVSTACLDFLGFDEDWLPEGMGNQMMSLAAVYIPLDGMNEKGLVVADLVAGDDEEIHQITEKPDVTTTLAIRLMLDYAANVDEAIELLEQYDMNSDIETAHHYSIADATGRAVVVEYVDGEMMVTDTKVVTNHYIADCEKKGVGSEQSHSRYNKLTEDYNNTQGVMSTIDVRNALQGVSQGAYGNEYEKTVWSIVYLHSEEGLTAEFYWNENYEECYVLKLCTEKQDKWLIKP